MWVSLGTKDYVFNIKKRINSESEMFATVTAVDNSGQGTLAQQKMSHVASVLADNVAHQCISPDSCHADSINLNQGPSS